jgi:hypothetical protein
VPPDEPLVDRLGQSMAQAAGYRAGRIPQLLYNATGGLDEWSFVTQGAPSYTIELEGDGFFGPFQRNVIDQYLGTGPRAHGGVREALLRAAEAAGDPATHGVLTGFAPAGAKLRAARRSLTATSALCRDKPWRTNWGSCDRLAVPKLLDETVAAETTVPADGQFAWHLGPSTRPFEARAGRTEAWTVTCEAGGAVVGRLDVVLERGRRLAIAPCDNGRTDATLAAPSRRLPTVSSTPVRRAVAAARGVRVRAGCPHACRARVALVANGQPVRWKTLALRAGKPRVVRLRLPSSVARSGRRVAVTVLDGGVRVERPVRFLR